MEHARPRLLIPQLQLFYRCAEPLSWALVRITAGLMLIPHGWPKLMAGIGPVAANALAKRGIQPAEPLAVILIAIETLGEPPPSRWQSSSTTTCRNSTGLDRGYEYPLFWGVVMLAIALRGGGPYSLDRTIGREL